jgi:hypothetical protein
MTPGTPTELEFWPEYSDGPLWRGGATADPAALGLPPELVDRLMAWNARYGDERLPVEGPGDAEWLAEGKLLLQQVRATLRGRWREGRSDRESH